MCDKSINTHLSIQFVPECYKTQEMCDKAVNRCFFVFIYILDWCKTHEMCDRVISEDPFIAPIDVKLKECVMKVLCLFGSIKIYS